MADEARTGGEQELEGGYEPPRVEDLPAQDGPAVTAAGTTLVQAIGASSG